MDYRELVTSIDTLRGVVAVYGREAYLTNHIKTKILERFEGDFGDLNVHRFDARTAKPEDILAACDTLPFVEDTKLVLVEEVDLTKSGASAMKVLFEALAERLASLPESTLLVLLSTSEKLFRGIFVRELEKTGEIVEMKKLQARELRAFIRTKLARAKKKTTPQVLGAIERAFDYLPKDGEDTLFDIDEKLGRLIRESGEIIEESDLAVLGAIEKRTIFRFLDEITAGKTPESLRSLDLLRASGLEEARIFAMMARQYRNLTILKTLTGDPSARKKAGLSPYEYDKLVPVARRFSREALLLANEKIYDVEERAKRLPVDFSGELDALTVELARLAP